MLLLVCQTEHIYLQSQWVYRTEWTQVEDIPDSHHVVICDGEEQVTLTTTPDVAKKLKTDGTVYGFYYKCSRASTNLGKLYGVWNMEE